MLNMAVETIQSHINKRHWMEIVEGFAASATRRCRVVRLMVSLNMINGLLLELRRLRLRLTC